MNIAALIRESLNADGFNPDMLEPAELSVLTRLALRVRTAAVWEALDDAQLVVDHEHGDGHFYKLMRDAVN